MPIKGSILIYKKEIYVPYYAIKVNKKTNNTHELKNTNVTWGREDGHIFIYKIDNRKNEIAVNIQ